MKVIFLDFNGVLDTYFNMDIVDYENLQRFKYLVKETGANVVLSSSIKNGYVVTGTMNQVLINLKYRLLAEGIEIYDFTSNLGNRELEIQDYLFKHPEVEEYVILDDDYNMVSFGKSMIKLETQSREYPCGLKDEHVNSAIKVLNKNVKPSKKNVK